MIRFRRLALLGGVRRAPKTYDLCTRAVPQAIRTIVRFVPKRFGILRLLIPIKVSRVRVVCFQSKLNIFVLGHRRASSYNVVRCGKNNKLQACRVAEVDSSVVAPCNACVSSLRVHFFLRRSQDCTVLSPAPCVHWPQVM